MKIQASLTAGVLFAALAASPALAEDLKFSLVNDTDIAVTAFHVSPASSKTTVSTCARWGLTPSTD